MINYVKAMPRDRTGEPMQGLSAASTAFEQYGATPAVSSVITLTQDTTSLEVGAAGGTGVVMRWVATTDTQASVIASGANANYDYFIPADSVRKFAVPIESNVGTSSVQGMNRANGLYQRVAWIAVGAPQSSVLTSEF